MKIGLEKEQLKVISRILQTCASKSNALKHLLNNKDNKLQAQQTKLREVIKEVNLIQTKMKMKTTLKFFQKISQNISQRGLVVQYLRKLLVHSIRRKLFNLVWYLKVKRQKKLFLKRLKSRSCSKVSVSKRKTSLLTPWKKRSASKKRL